MRMRQTVKFSRVHRSDSKSNGTKKTTRTKVRVRKRK